MDSNRLRELAGSASSDTDLLVELEQLNEKMYRSKHGIEINTDVMPLEEIQRLMDTASRALGIANRLRNPEEKRKHMSIVMSHLNTIRGALQHAIKSTEGNRVEI